MNCAQASAHLGDHLEGDLPLRERSQVDLHLEQCPDCARELAELRRTIALVRSLPDPEPPAELIRSVMQRIDAGETRVTRLPLPMRRLFDPRVAAPLAAGIAGLVLFATLETGSPAPETVAASQLAEVTVAANPMDAQMWNENPPTLGDKLESARLTQGRRFSVQPRLVAIQRNQATRFFRPQARIASVGFYGRTDPDPHHLDLDADLDRALSGPEAFLRFVSNMDESERNALIAPMAVRAARRGDAADVAGRLRHSTHPLAPKAAEPFERLGRRSRTLQVMPASYQR